MYREVILLFYFKFTGMRNIARKGIHYWQKLNAANVPAELIENGQNRVIDASLTLIRERAKLKVFPFFSELFLLGCSSFMKKGKNNILP